MESINVKDLRFVLTDSDGNDIKCDILYELFDENEGKAYIAYTDYVIMDDGKYRILISELLKNGDEYSVTSVKNQEIYKQIESQVKALFLK